MMVSFHLGVLLANSVQFVLGWVTSVNNSIAGHPHLIDFYLPDTQPSSAIIFLHGGGGSKEGVVASLGLIADWVDTRNIAVIVPQGFSKRRPLLDRPGKAYTWNNHVMDSGVDDVAFLTDLSAYLRDSTSGVGAPVVHLAGHSNGGFMSNRMWCEAPESFGACATFSGPPSIVYDPQGPSQVCQPSVALPLLAVFGDADDNLGIKDNIDGHVWSCGEGLVSISKYAWVDPRLVNDLDFFTETRATAICGEHPSRTPTAHSSQADIYEACDGQARVMQVKGSGHRIPELQNVLNQSLLSVAADFFAASGGVRV